MSLSEFEKRVLRIMLQGKLESNRIENIINTASIANYEYTGAGYFLEIKSDGIDLKDETIHDPIVVGQFQHLSVGFILFGENNRITIECHAWGEANPPHNIRQLEIEIRTE